MPKKKAPSRLEDARTRMYQDLIFESAECVFGEKGFETATMQDIASEAGVSLKTIYASFPGKQELYNAIMLLRGREMFEAVARAHAAAKTPLEQLIEGTRAFVRYLVDHRDWSRIHVRSQTSWAMRPEGHETGLLWDDGQRAHIDMLEAGAADGVFYDDDPAEMALLIRAMTRVQVVQALENGEEDADVIGDRLLQRLLRLVCKEPTELREAG
ncbi:MAG: TetR/AcrR family transcriptional regulator [bacterium]|nr:TetR/AcrR family transcriptional regulator [bacterium]